MPFVINWATDVLFLNHSLVRAQFLKRGQVYTLRAHRRKLEGLQILVQGSRFKHRPVGRGLVILARELKKLTPRALAPFVRHSGFKSAKDWLEAYRRLNGGKCIEPAFLYQVTRLKAKR